MIIEQETVPCRLCDKPTPMLGTRLCDRCWELETRIKRDHALACKILHALEFQSQASEQPTTKAQQP